MAGHDSHQRRRTGSEYTQQSTRYAKTNDFKISDAANLVMATWNCGGLTKIKKDLVSKLNQDIVCMTETHGWRDNDPAWIYSDMPEKTDSYSGTALVVGKRLSGYVIASGSIGSRIVYCRLRGTSCNLFIIGVYIPQRRRTNPDQNDIYEQLETLLLKVKPRDCIILMGDFNSRLARDIEGRVGHWSIHNRSDSGGERLLDIMEKIPMRCVSTQFQPRRNHNNATFMNIQPGKAPSQIDHILVSSRWYTAVRSCRTKWGISIDAYGRKYDHALIQMNFKIRLRREKPSTRRDFTALKNADVKNAYAECIEANFNSKPRPDDVNGQWTRLTTTLQNAQQTLPSKKKRKGRKWETSEQTYQLAQERSKNWPNMNAHDRKILNKQISRSARDDYRRYVDSLVHDIERENSVGNSTEVFRLAKSLSANQNRNLHIQPAIDQEGSPITSTEQQQDEWANFLEKKFAARDGETEVNLQQTEDETLPPDITLDEVKACVHKLKPNKSPGPDSIPVEQYKASDQATIELHCLLLNIWKEECTPDGFVLADMMMMYKKKCKNDRANYRALGLLNHGYKIFAMVLLLRIMPIITPKLSDMQSGFRKGRGCRDNILMLVMTVQKMLEDAEDESKCRGILTYIDFTAAFDSILHSYLLNALVEYGVPLKYCRLVKAIYDSAEIRVRLQEPGGARSYSRNVSISRGVIQGDIPSPICFLVALDKLLKDHGHLNSGIHLSDTLFISSMEYADDAVLPDESIESASNRLTNLDLMAQEDAGMKISIAKTKAQHIRPRPKVSETTEDDVQNLPADRRFKFECDKCGMTYPSKHGLAVHKGRRFCKGRRTAKKPSRKGTVADRIITKMKVEKHQATYEKVTIGAEELENVYSFVYLGAEIPSDGDPIIPVKHRCDVAWGRWGDYRKALMPAKLPVDLRIRLYKSLIVSTMTYSSEAWKFTDQAVRKINGVNSKMLSLITKRSIHEEARTPTFDVVDSIKARRWEYLGHILRMDQNRALRRFVTELSPESAPYKQGSLMSETPFQNAAEMIQAAEDRKLWRSMGRSMRKRVDNE